MKFLKKKLHFFLGPSSSLGPPKMHFERFFLKNLHTIFNAAYPSVVENFLSLAPFRLQKLNSGQYIRIWQARKPCTYERLHIIIPMNQRHRQTKSPINFLYSAQVLDLKARDAISKIGIWILLKVLSLSRFIINTAKNNCKTIKKS